VSPPSVSHFGGHLTNRVSAASARLARRVRGLPPGAAAHHDRQAQELKTGEGQPCRQTALRDKAIHEGSHAPQPATGHYFCSQSARPCKAHCILLHGHQIRQCESTALSRSTRPAAQCGREDRTLLASLSSLQALSLPTLLPLHLDDTLATHPVPAALETGSTPGADNASLTDTDLLPVAADIDRAVAQEEKDRRRVGLDYRRVVRGDARPDRMRLSAKSRRTTGWPAMRVGGGIPGWPSTQRRSREARRR
jgi:hypothetical protein